MTFANTWQVHSTYTKVIDLFSGGSARKKPDYLQAFKRAHKCCLLHFPMQSGASAVASRHKHGCWLRLPCSGWFKRNPKGTSPLCGVRGLTHIDPHVFGRSVPFAQEYVVKTSPVDLEGNLLEICFRSRGRTSKWKIWKRLSDIGLVPFG